MPDVPLEWSITGCILTFGKYYGLGIERAKDFREIVPMSTLHNLGVLAAALHTFTGDHADIGTREGSSAIIAASFKAGGKVFSIDPEPYHAAENVKKVGLEDKIVLVTAKSDPWPIGEIETAYIDGDHTGDMPLRDFLSCVGHGASLVAFDDVHSKWPAVIDAFRIACIYPGWLPVHLSGRIGVVMRATASELRAQWVQTRAAHSRMTPDQIAQYLAARLSQTVSRERTTDAGPA
jgi:hypothetical protein